MTLSKRLAISRENRRTLVILFVGVLMGALDIAIVGPALPAIGSTYGLDERSLAWVFTIYVLFHLIGTPIIARLADLYGRRRLFLIGIGLFTAGSLLVALAPSYPVMLFGRAVQGFGSGGIFPIAAGVIGDTFPPEARGAALGMLGAVFGLAFLIGPIIGGTFLRFGSWQWLFLINLPIGIVLMIAALRSLPVAGRPVTGAFDLPGVVLLSLALAALALGIAAIDAEHLLESLASPQVWPLLLAALACLAVFWWVENRSASPLIEPALMRNRQLVIANLLSVIAGFVEAGFVFVPSLIVAAFAVGPDTASFYLLPPVLALGVGAPVTGRLLDRHGSRVVVLLGSLVLGISLLGIAPGTGNVLLFMAVAVSIGLGLSSLVGAPLRYIVLNEASLEYRSSAQAVNTLFRSSGRMVGGVLLGAVIASRATPLSGYHLAFQVLAIIVLAGAVLALGLKDRQAEQRAAARSTQLAPGLRKGTSN